MNKNVLHNLEVPIKMEDLDKLSNLIEDARFECLSRSGMTDWNYTKGDRSNFSIVFLAATIDTIKSIAQKEMLTEVLKNKIVSRFMSYQHEMIVQKLHFNWNWD